MGEREWKRGQMYRFVAALAGGRSKDRWIGRDEVLSPEERERAQSRMRRRTQMRRMKDLFRTPKLSGREERDRDDLRDPDNGESAGEG